MADALQFDEKALLHLEMTYRAPEVAAQRRVLLETIAPRSGERALDIGCGPGFVTEELARAVGTAGEVCAMDNSASSVMMTQRRCAEFPNVQVQAADATQLPYPDAHFDLAVSTQVYEYVPDVRLALSELCRVLRPGGRACDHRHGLALDSLALERSFAHGSHLKSLGRTSRASRPAANTRASAARQWIFSPRVQSNSVP